MPRAGNFKCNSALTMRGGVTLCGHSKEGTVLNFSGANVDCITFDSTVRYGGLRDLYVQGYNGAGETKSTVVVAENAPVILRRCLIWGSLNGLTTAGVDGTIEDCFIAAKSGTSILSSGANWYRRCKIDTVPGNSVADAFIQGARSPGLPVTVMENHFDQCDFSGQFTRSVSINDGGQASAISVFTGCVMSSNIVITAHNAALFTACEFGSTTFTTPGNTAVNGCYKLGPALSIANATKSGNLAGIS